MFEAKIENPTIVITMDLFAFITKSIATPNRFYDTSVGIFDAAEGRIALTSSEATE